MRSFGKPCSKAALDFISLMAPSSELISVFEFEELGLDFKVFQKFSVVNLFVVVSFLASIRLLFRFIAPVCSLMRYQSQLFFSLKLQHVTIMHRNSRCHHSRQSLQAYVSSTAQLGCRNLLCTYLSTESHMLPS